MIISASYKTDIPAFYGEWFMNRLRAGFCMMVNSYNRHRALRVSLRREHVDGIVFWTKNAGPFLGNLVEVRERGFPFVVQYTINGYPRQLEYSVADATLALRHASKIARQHGPKVLVWRYDPIVFSSETPIDRHLENFAWIAGRLEGMTDEVVISFAQIYQKTKRNMDRASTEFGFSWTDPDDEKKRALLRQLSELARQRKMRITLCSQPYLLEPNAGVAEAHCVDAQRLSALAGNVIQARLKGARKECGCFESRDIGDYDTCPHGCVYCYAVLDRSLARRRHSEHDPNSEFLFSSGTVVIQREKAEPTLF
jgi:hypothetical protein